MITICCPACGGALASLPAAYHCEACGRQYPVVLGIPDLRVFPDPYIDYADDRAKGARVLEGMDDADFETIVRRYWELTPDVPRDLVEGYVAHVLAASQRAESILAEAQHMAAHLGATQVDNRNALLEIGCGTGGLLIAAARQYQRVVGVDIAFRWLLIATRRIQHAVRTGELTEEQAARIQLLCACAEQLPLPSETFDIVVGASTIEHAQRQADVFRQAHNALRGGGVLFLTTVNRWSLAPEPHVNVWGVGFMPRRWMESYVRRIRGVAYRNIHLLSSLELVQLLRRSGFAPWQIYPASVSNVDMMRYSPVLRAAASAYLRVRRAPVARQALTIFGPLLHVAAVRRAAQPGLNRRLTVARPSDP